MSGGPLRWLRGEKEGNETAVAVQSVAAGRMRGDPPAFDALEPRLLLSAGDLDPTFGIGGIVVTDIVGETADAPYAGPAVQADGRILLAGSVGTLNGRDVAIVRYNQDGSLDASFGQGGRVLTDFGGDDYGVAISIQQSDGRILVAGWSGLSTLVACYNTDGALDLSFGVNGVVIANYGAYASQFYDMAVMSDGRVVAAGRCQPDSGNADRLVVRYLSNGTLDPSFGTGGIVINDVSATSWDYVAALSVQPDGSVVTGGTRATDVGFASFASVRYNQDGTLDEDFASGGVLCPDIYLSFADLCVQGDGKIVVAGRYPGSSSFALLRYNIDGSKDINFGSGGSVSTTIPGASDSAVDSVLCQPDGKIIATARFADWSVPGVTEYAFAAARYNYNGGLDTDFDGDGITTIPFGGYEPFVYSNTQPTGAAIDDQGRLIIAGYTAIYPSGLDFALARLNANGALDTSFDQDGRATTSYGSSTSQYGRALAVLRPDDRILVAGYTADSGSHANGEIMLAQYLSDGTLDPDFGDGGIAAPDLVTVWSAANCMAVQSDGKIVVGGVFSTAQGPNLGLARYESNGAVDFTFGNGGIVQTAVGYDERFNELVIDSQGRIIAVGGVQHAGNLRDVVVVRYLGDGTLDSTFGAGGITTIDFGQTYEMGYGVCVDAIERIIVVGTNYTGSRAHLVARLDGNGVLDKTFGTDGKIISTTGRAYDCVVQPDGKILVGGRENSQLAAFRYNPDGTPDTSFGDDGIATFATPSYVYPDGISMALQADGKIALAAAYYTTTQQPHGYDYMIGRFNPDGSIDSTFGANGYTITDLGWTFDVPYDVALDSQGRIVVAGSTFQPDTGSDIALVRYIGVTNRAPVATDDTAVTDEETPVTIPVLANDTDPDGDLLSVIAVGAAKHGTVVLNADGALTYKPDADFDGLDAFQYTISDGNGGEDTGTVTVKVNRFPELSGRVFDDLDNDGADDGEPGIAGVSIRLTGLSDQGPVDLLTVTGADGSFLFEDLRPGTYSLEELEQPVGLLDGKEIVGTLAGSVNNNADSNVISGITAVLDGPDGTGYGFGEIQPSVIQGMVWEDFNNDGEVNFGEKVIEGVSIELTGTDDRGNAVSLQALTDSEGLYLFDNLRPGTYVIHEVQPAGYNDGQDVLGTVNGVPTGSHTANDVLGGVVLSQPGSVGVNYNFGERPADAGTVEKNQTASVGFWHNKHGQALIRSLNGSPDSTLLSHWLAVTFPNMYGAGAGANNLEGRTNAQVAEFYKEVFLNSERANKAGGSPKLEARTLALAFACYVTNQTLVEFCYVPEDPENPTVDPTLKSIPESYEFMVTELGVGACSFNVGDSGEAFGVADDTELVVMDILRATDARTVNGVLYDLDGDGQWDDLEILLRRLANDVYGAINS